MITEYTYHGIAAYKGKVVCPTCKQEYEIDTIDKNVALNPPSCFKCKVEGKNAK